MRTILILRPLAALIIGVLMPCQSFAHSVSGANTARIEELEALVATLELRVSALENPSNQDPASAQGIPPSTAWQNITPWRSLERGMSKAQVRALLGEPEKIKVLGTMEQWGWDEPAGPFVRFYDGKLDGWEEPVRL